MKHPFTKTIKNLEWLQEQDFSQEIWDKIFIPIVDELNLKISKFKVLISLAKDGDLIENTRNFK